MPLTRPLALAILLAALAAPAVPAAAQGRCRAFPETGQRVCGRILEYWEQNGGLPVFGLPIGPPASEPVEGRTYQVQWFERNRLELHPENIRPYDVLLGRLGADILQAAGRDWAALPKGDRNAPAYFREIGHAIAPPFLDYWLNHGLEFDGRPGAAFAESLALFGMPLTEPALETNSSGETVLTQWFERARFEHHPGNPAPYTVLLGRLGAELRGGAPAPAPPTPDPREAAARVIALVNQERAAVGCPALVANDTLARVAAAHSRDMAEHDFFDHPGSDGRSPFQRMADAGYRATTAAENIAAGASTPDKVVQLWMHSPGHRANILNCAYRETGVGYVADPGDRLNYGVYWTQVFGAR